MPELCWRWPGQNDARSRAGAVDALYSNRCGKPRVETYPRPGTSVMLVVLCVGGVSGAFAQTYTNPLITPAFPSAGAGCCGPADPCVIEFEGTYYVYPTGEGWGYKVMASDDLVHWTGNAAAFTLPANSPWKNGSVWAPDVERINGTFYLYYTAGNGGLEGQRIGVAESASPWGPFVDRSLHAPLIADVTIDAECFQDNGELYLYYVRFENGRLSTWVRQLADPLTLAPTAAVLCISAAGWEATVNEGPSVLKRNGKYYMFYSGNYAHTADYGVGVAVADHPMGPWSKQPAPYNPVLRRNDAIALYGPGHGHNIVGPDGVSDWYVYHHKIDPTDTFFGGLNYRRWLVLDRMIPVARSGSQRLRFTSSGTTGPTLAPRRATLFSNFDRPPFPLGMTPESGNWSVAGGRLVAPADGILLVDRPLPTANLQDFVCEWWLRAEAGFVPGAESSIAFTYARASGSQRLGFRIRPSAANIEFGEYDAPGAGWYAIASFTIPGMDWSAFSRRITIVRQGSLWRVLIDREPVCEVMYPATLGRSSWLATSALPCSLDGYRYTTAFEDDFECSACTTSRWTSISGQWNFASATGGDDGYFRQTDMSAGMKLALCNTVESDHFDVGADFLLLDQLDGSGRFPKHGLLHSYTDANNYAMVFIDEQYDVVATNAVVGGVFQQWVNAAAPMPTTYAAGGYRRLSAATDLTAGEFVYSLNGTEMIRRSYPGLSAGGQTGLICELSRIAVDNFRVSHALPIGHITLDRTVIQRTVHIARELAPDTLLIRNGGEGVLTYRVSSDAAWLRISPAGGEVAGEAAPVRLTYDLAGLPAGTHIADLAAVALSSDNSPQHVRVEVRIETVRPDFDGDGDVDQSDFGILQACATELSPPPIMAPGCEAADLDGNGRVMGSDFQLFQACFGGPGVVPPAECLP